MATDLVGFDNAIIGLSGLGTLASAHSKASDCNQNTSDQGDDQNRCGKDQRQKGRKTGGNGRGDGTA
jgi:hypothetical protein